MFFESLAAQELQVSQDTKRSSIVARGFGYRLNTGDTTVSGNGLGVEAGLAITQNISLFALYSQTVSRKNIAYSGFSQIGFGSSFALTGQLIQSKNSVVLNGQKASQSKVEANGFRLNITSSQYSLNTSPYSLQMPGFGAGISYDMPVLEKNVFKSAVHFDRLSNDVKPLTNLFFVVGYGTYL